MHLGEADVNDLINDEEALSVYDAAWQLVQSKQGFSKTRISHHISKGLANFRVKCCKEKTATERFAKFCFQSAIQRWSWLEAQQVGIRFPCEHISSQSFSMHNQDMF
jgi:predicted lipoprotein